MNQQRFPTDPQEQVSARSASAQEPLGRKKSRRPRWPFALAVVILLTLVAVAGNVLAPLSAAPVVHFATATPPPIATQRAANTSATPLPDYLREQAEITYVNGLISKMSLNEEIGQMVMIGFSETQMDAALAYQIQQLHVGSAIIYDNASAPNIQNGPQLTALISGMQADASIPLLVATDQEGGSVNRMQTIIGPTPSAWSIGATNNPSVAKQRGVQDANALASVGINLNLAPDVDVLQTPGGAGDIGSRSFGSTPQLVTKMAGAYLDGLQSSGKVVGTLKHFPGLGDVPVDPHQTLYTLNRSLSQLNAVDWAPYKALIGQGDVYAVMSTHIILSAVDPAMPASLSYKDLTGVLRDQLGFNGVVITDGIYMQALSAYGLDQIAVDAVAAGNDIICSTYSIQSTQEVITALHNAVSSGKITKSRIDDSVRRILLLKLRLGLLPAPQFQS